MSLEPPIQQQLQQQQFQPQIQQQQQTGNFPRIVDIRTDGIGKETYIKAFLMDDTINQNFWHVPTTSMKKYASSFVGRPLIYHPSGQHPDYIKEGVVYNPETFVNDILKFQDRFKIGDIIYVNQQHVKESPDKKAWYATIRVTNPDVLEQIKSGNISSFVSPQIYDINGSEPNQATTDFIPLHLAVVSEPAYGNRARIRASCTGTGMSCINALKSANNSNKGPCSCGCNGGKGETETENKDNSSSSFFEKSASDNHTTLNNPNIREDPNQLYQDPRYRPEDYSYSYNQQGQQPQQQGQTQAQNQLLNEKTQRQEVDANGNLITNTVDKKPTRGRDSSSNNSNPNAQQQQQQQVNPNSPRPQTAQATQYQPRQQGIGSEENNPQTGYVPSTAQLVNPQLMQTPQMASGLNPLGTGSGTSQINASDPQLPSALVDALKEIEGLKQQISQFDQFKKTEEEKQVKAASEAQRQLIESFLTPDLVPDENARQEMVNYFVSLNLQDDDIKKLLDLLVSGKFTAPPQQKAAPPKNQATAPNVNQASITEENPQKRIKGASLIMNNLSRSAEPKDRYYSRNTSAYSNGFLTGINPEDLSF